MTGNAAGVCLRMTSLLKRKLQGQLYLPPRPGAENLPEGRTGNADPGVAEHRVIQPVEHFAAKGQPAALPDGKRLVDAEVPRKRAGTPRGVVTQVAEPAGRYAECRRVEPLE